MVQPLQDTSGVPSGSDLKHPTPARPKAPVLARPKGRSRSARWGVRLTVLAGLFTGVGLLPMLLKKPPLPVTVAKVERGTVRDEVSSSTAGEVVPLKHATVRCELAARVTAVHKDRGDRAKKGEVIVELDAADLAARLEQALATIAAQDAQLGQARARAHALRRSAERAKTLEQKGAGTAQLTEDAEAAAREAEEAVRAAESLLQQSRAALRVAQVARGKAALTAPFDGMLIEVTPDPGDELAPAQPVFEIIDDTRLHVEATVDEADAGKVRVGQPAVLKLDGLPGHPIAGTLSKVAPAVRKDLKGARTLGIEVEVDDVKAATEAGLRPGMSANVEVRVAEKRDVVSLPTNVIIGRGTKRTVYKIEDGVARVREVQVGLSNWERTEVLGGLSAGDVVIATLNEKGLEDGTSVRPR